MPTTTITVSSFQTALAECADAIADEDWRTAKLKYAKAEAILCGLEQSIGDGDANLTRRASLEKLNAAINAAKAEVSEQDNAQTTFADFGYFRD